MRTLVYSLAAELKPNSRYKKTIIDAIPLNKLLTTYKLPLYCIVFDTVLNDYRAFDLSQFEVDIKNRPITIVEYLASLDQIPIEYLDAIPELHTAYAKYADAFYAGYEITPWVSMGDPTDVKIKEPWLKLSKYQIDYRRLFTTTLVSVNGLIHQTDYNSAGLYVVDGNKTAKLLNRNSIGLINISEFGSFAFKYFNKEIEYKKAIEDSDYYNGTYLVFNEDISHKTPIFVIGGHVFINHPAFSRVDANAFKLRFDLLDYRSLVFEVHKLLKFNNPELDFNEEKFNLISNETLYSDKLIETLLDLSQSFVLFVDKNFFVEDIPLTIDQTSNWINTKETPDKPLFGYQGKVLEYVWQTDGAGEFILHCENSHFDRLVMKSDDKRPMTNQLDPDRAKKTQKPHFLHFGLDL